MWRRLSFGWRPARKATSGNTDGCLNWQATFLYLMPPMMLMMAHWGLSHSIWYLSKKLKLVSHHWNSQNNGPVLFFETGFSVTCCNGWKGIGRVYWKLRKACKSYQKWSWLVLSYEIWYYTYVYVHKLWQTFFLKLKQEKVRFSCQNSIREILSGFCFLLILDLLKYV